MNRKSSQTGIYGCTVWEEGVQTRASTARGFAGNGRGRSGETGWDWREDSSRPRLLPKTVTQWPCRVRFPDCGCNERSRWVGVRPWKSQEIPESESGQIGQFWGLMLNLFANGYFPGIEFWFRTNGGASEPKEACRLTAATFWWLTSPGLAFICGWLMVP